MRRLLPLLMIISIACSGPLRIDQVDADTDALLRQARQDLKEPQHAARGHLHMALLCLLHGQRCQGAASHAKAASETATHPALAQLAYALMAQGSVEERAEAWLKLTTPTPLAHGSRQLMTTIAVSGLAQLAKVDALGVRQALSQEARAQLKTACLRVRDPHLRHRAFVALQTLGVSLPLIGRRPADAMASVQPLRGYPLAHLERPRPTKMATRQVSFTAHRGYCRLELPLPRDRGVYWVALADQVTATGERGLWVRASAPATVWLDRDRAATVPPGDLGVWLSVPAGRRVNIAAQLDSTEADLEVAWSPRREVRPLSAGVWRELETTLIAPRRSKRWRGPLSALLGLTLGQAGRRADLDAVLRYFPNHLRARVRRAARARADGQLHYARRLMMPLLRARMSQPSLKRRVDLSLELAELHQLDGLGDLAAARAVELLKGQGQPTCKTWSRVAAVALDNQHRPLARRLLKLPRCSEEAPMKWADLLVVAGRPPWAFLQRQSARARWRRDANAKARALSAHAPRLAPWAWAAASAKERASIKAQGLLDSGESKAAWSALLTAPNLPMELRRRAWNLGATPPWRGLEIDGQRQVQSHPAEQRSTSPVTWLLDHEIVVGLPGGGMLRRVHQMIRVHTVGAAEAVGEVGVPANAELVLARTWTPDGRVVAPAETPDKTTLSLRSVMPGAVVEYIQVQFVDPVDTVSGATRTPTFLFRSRDGRTVESRYDVIDSASEPVDVQASPTAPQSVKRQHGSWRLRSWRRRAAEPFELEAHTPRPAWQLPAVAASIRATRGSVVLPWENTLARYRRGPAELIRPWISRAKSADGDASAWRALLKALFRQVRHRRRGSSPEDPNLALKRGRGDRASLVWTIARRAGVEACLIRAVPWSKQLDQTRHRWAGYDRNDYAVSAVALNLGPANGKRWRWIDVNAGRLDYLRPSVQRRPALVLGCSHRDRWATTPKADPKTRSSRRVEVDVQWRGDGAYVAEVRDTISGALVSAVEQARRERPDALLRQVSRLAFPSGRATWRPLGATDATVAKITLRYSVTGNSNSSGSLELGLSPYRLGSRYARSSSRKTTMLMSHDVDLRVDVTVRSETGALSSRPLKLPQHPLLTVTRKITGQGSRALTISHRLRAKMGLLSAAEYPAFAYVARSADQAERLKVERR